MAAEASSREILVIARLSISKRRSERSGASRYDDSCLYLLCLAFRFFPSPGNGQVCAILIDDIEEEILESAKGTFGIEAQKRWHYAGKLDNGRCTGEIQ